MKYNNKIIPFLIMIFMILGCGNQETNLPPIIDDFGIDPLHPEPESYILFWAFVSDGDLDLRSVYLYYDFGEGFEYVEMINSDISRDYYSYRISPLLPETHCRYYFKATDELEAAATTETFEFTVLYSLPAIYTQPESDTIMVGESTQIDIRMGGVDSLFAVSLELNFDNSIIEIDSITASDPGIWGDGDPILVYNNTANGIGMAIGLIQTSENDNITGYGSLFLLHLHGSAGGITSLDFIDVEIYDENGILNPYMNYLEVVPCSLYID